MAYTQTDLDLLEKAIAQGARRVKYADKEVEYRDLNEMQDLRRIMRDELGLNGTNPARRLRKYGSFNKGL